MAESRPLFLGPRLKRLRRELGLTQSAMAQDLRISPDRPGPSGAGPGAYRRQLSKPSANTNPLFVTTSKLAVPLRLPLLAVSVVPVASV